MWECKRHSFKTRTFSVAVLLSIAAKVASKASGDPSTCKFSVGLDGISGSNADNRSQTSARSTELLPKAYASHFERFRFKPNALAPELTRCRSSMTVDELPQIVPSSRYQTLNSEKSEL